MKIGFVYGFEKTLAISVSNLKGLFLESLGEKNKKKLVGATGHLDIIMLHFRVCMLALT